MKIDLPLDAKTRARIRPSSKALFQGQYVLEALVVIEQEAEFYPALIAEMTGCGENYAGAFLSRIDGAGFIERKKSDAGQRRKYFAKRNWEGWGFASNLLTALLAAPEAEVAELAERRRDEGGSVA